jgi:hypothetical protein
MPDYRIRWFFAVIFLALATLVPVVVVPACFILTVGIVIEAIFTYITNRG